MGGPGIDVGTGVAADGAGNVYVSGTLWGTATFGTVSLTSAGGTDAFVAKLDSAGNVPWAKHLGGAGDDAGVGIAVDGSGNAYVTGVFSGTATFGTVSLTSAGDTDIFVAKLDGAGNVAWAKRMGGSGDDAGVGIAVDGAGGIY